MNQLAEAVPGAGQVIRARRQLELGDILSHMEMADLIRWVGSRSERASIMGPATHEARDEVSQFLLHLERAFETGDQDMDELIAVGFLEGLHLAGAEYERIRASLPPKMSAWLASTGD